MQAVYCYWGYSGIEWIKMAVWNGNGERQYLRAVGSFLGQLQTENLIGAITCEMFVFTLFCEIHNIHYMKWFVKELDSLFNTCIVFYLDNMTLGGVGLQPPENRGRL